MYDVEKSRPLNGYFFFFCALKCGNVGRVAFRTISLSVSVVSFNVKSQPVHLNVYGSFQIFVRQISRVVFLNLHITFYDKILKISNLSSDEY